MATGGHRAVDCGELRKLDAGQSAEEYYYFLTNSTVGFSTPKPHPFGSDGRPELELAGVSAPRALAPALSAKLGGPPGLNIAAAPFLPGRAAHFVGAAARRGHAPGTFPAPAAGDRTSRYYFHQYEAGPDYSSGEPRRRGDGAPGPAGGPAARWPEASNSVARRPQWSLLDHRHAPSAQQPEAAQQRQTPSGEQKSVREAECAADTINCDRLGEKKKWMADKMRHDASGSGHGPASADSCAGAPDAAAFEPANAAPALPAALPCAGTGAPTTSQQAVFPAETSSIPEAACRDSSTTHTQLLVQKESPMGFAALGWDDDAVMSLPEHERRDKVESYVRGLSTHFIGTPLPGPGAQGGPIITSVLASPATASSDGPAGCSLKSSTGELPGGPGGPVLKKLEGARVDDRLLYQTFFCNSEWGADRIQLKGRAEAKFVNGKKRVQRQALERKSGAIIELFGR